MQKILFSFLLILICDLSAFTSYKKSDDQTASPYGYAISKMNQKNDIFLNGTFLYWQSNVGGLAFATENNEGTAAAPGPPTVTESQVDTPEFSFDPGFRVNLGYLSKFDHWVLLAGWTYFKGDFHETVTANLGVDPLWYIPHTGFIETNVVFNSAVGSWSMHTNAIDLICQKYVITNPSTTFSIGAGLKGAWYKQKLKLDYRISDQFTMTAGQSTDFTCVSSEVQDQTQKSWGLGPQIGAGSEMTLYEKLNLVANLSCALVYFYDDLTITDTETVAVTGEVTGTFSPTTHLTDSFSNFRPIYQMELGFKWERSFEQSQDVRLILAAKYELQYWWNYNQLRQTLNALTLAPSLQSVKGDMQTQGVNISLGIEF